MGVPVVVDWWLSLRSVPPKEAIVALVSKAGMLAVEEAVEKKCLASWASLEVVDDREDEEDGVADWRCKVRNRIRRAGTTWDLETMMETR